MNVVWKYPLPGGVVQEVVMPEGAVIRRVGHQNDCPTIWAEHVHVAEPIMVVRRIRLVGTGHPEILPDSIYLGTADIFGGGIVLHVYEEPTEHTTKGDTPT